MKRRLELHDFDEALRRVSYLPGWYMRLYLHGDEGPGLQIIVDIDNSYRIGNVVLDIRSVIPPCYTFEEFYDWLWWRLGRIALHERSEWFKVNGKAWKDPHADSYTDAVRVNEEEQWNGNTQGSASEASGEEVRRRSPANESGSKG